MRAPPERPLITSPLEAGQRRAQLTAFGRTYHWRQSNSCRCRRGCAPLCFVVVSGWLSVIGAWFGSLATNDRRERGRRQFASGDARALQRARV